MTKRQHKRNTLLTRPPSVLPTTPTPPHLSHLSHPVPKSGQRGVRPLRLAPPSTSVVKAPLPSAPLRQSSSGEMVQDFDLPSPDQGGDQPRSAGRGKRSFLRPFLLKGKKKIEPRKLDKLDKHDKHDKVDQKDIDNSTQARSRSDRDQKKSEKGAQSQEVLFEIESQSPNEFESESEWTHVPRPSSKEPVFEPRAISRSTANRGDTVTNILEGYMDDDMATESAYEETAYISGSLPQALPRLQLPRDSGLPIQVPLDQLIDHPAEFKLEPEPKTSPENDQFPDDSQAASPRRPFVLESNVVDVDVERGSELAPVFAHKGARDRERPNTHKPSTATELELNPIALEVGSTPTPTHEASSAKEKPHGTTPSSIEVGPGADGERDGEEDPLSPLSPLTPIVSPSTSIPPSPPTPSHSSPTPAPPHAKTSESDTERSTERSRTPNIGADGHQTEGGRRTRPSEDGDEKSDKRERKDKSRPDDRDRKGDEKRRIRNSTSKSKVPEQQWLEVVFDGLPFGPNGTTVSTLILHSPV